MLKPIAVGTKELEAEAIIDALHRAGAAVTVATVSGNHQIKASRGIVIVTASIIVL